MPFRGSDDALVAGLGRREAPAVAALFERYDDEVLRLLARILGPVDPELVGIHHDAFVRALARAKEATPRRLDHWVARIAIDEVRDVLHRRRWPWRRPATTPTDDQALLDALPVEERIAAALYFVDGRTDVGSATGSDSATSARLLARAERRLRAEPDVASWGARLHDEQDTQLALIDTSETLARLLDHDLAPSAGPRRRLRTAAMALAAVTALGAGVLTWWWWPRPLTFTVDGVTAVPGGSAGPGVLQFSDGTVVRIGDGTEATVTQVTGQGASLDVRHGTVFLAVIPRPAGRWTLRLGPFEIAVKGTKLEASWDGSALSVNVFEGSVVIAGPTIDGEHVIHADETWTATIPR